MEMPPGMRAQRVEASYAGLVRNPQALQEFLEDCTNGYRLNGLVAEPFSEYLRRRVTVGGRPWSFASLCVATEDASAAWDEDGDWGEELRRSIEQFNACNRLQAHGTMDLTEFVMVWPSRMAERMLG